MKPAPTPRDQADRPGGARPPSPAAAGSVRHNLVALGAAAVLTVYAAGYARTRDAAQRFAEADQAGRHPVAPTEPVVPQGSEVAPVATVAAPAILSPPAPAPGGERASATVTADSSRSDPVPAPAAPVTRVATSADSTGAIPAPSDPAPAPSAIPTADSVTAPAAADTAPSRPAYKDGEYYGWGTSRHGDIQAGIQIKDGRIAAAWIQQCLTRYSCSWIAKLPGQVVDRQSPETDYVSGATQSTNAFYYAVVEALSRAR